MLVSTANRINAQSVDSGFHRNDVGTRVSRYACPSERNQGMYRMGRHEACPYKTGGAARRTISSTILDHTISAKCNCTINNLKDER
jgi:hypothetical protein